MLRPELSRTETTTPEYENEKVQIDVYNPDKENCPVVILIHGSAGITGDRAARYERFASDLEKEGVIALNVHYFDTQRDPVDTIVKAIDYAEDIYNADPGRIGLIGYSSGGTIALLAASLDDRVKLLVISSGGLPTGFTKEDAMDLPETYIRAGTNDGAINTLYQLQRWFKELDKPLTATIDRDRGHSIPVTEFWANWKDIVFFVTEKLEPAAVQEDGGRFPRRVLFIGNSYTAQIKDCLVQMLKNSPYNKSEFAFAVRGGSDLQYHLSNQETLERIRTGNWDYVVIQEQSLMPALAGEYEKAFHRSVDQFTKIIREAGSEPILYMTWGRRDGDQDNQEIFPDYETMQKKLSSAYIAAARRNQVLLAPVGDAWSSVRQRDKKLGLALYKADGSHPSDKGAHLASYVFFWGLFPGSLESMDYQGTLTEEESQVFKDSILNLYPTNDEQVASKSK